MSEKLTFDDLSLLPGTIIDLRSEQYSILKGRCSYIGYQSKRFLIVSTPVLNGTPVSCKAGTQVTLRFFVNHMNCACAFVTEVVHVTVSPYPQLFLALPDKMQVGEVRKSARVKVDLPALVTAEDYKAPKSVVITNLSADGAKIQMEDLVGDSNDIVLSTRIKILGKETLVKVSAKVMSRTEEAEIFSYGVKFEGIKHHEKLALYAYVLENLTGRS